VEDAGAAGEAAAEIVVEGVEATAPEEPVEGVEALDEGTGCASTAGRADESGCGGGVDVVALGGLEELGGAEDEDAAAAVAAAAAACCADSAESGAAAVEVACCLLASSPMAERGCTVRRGEKEGKCTERGERVKNLTILTTRLQTRSDSVVLVEAESALMLARHSFCRSESRWTISDAPTSQTILAENCRASSAETKLIPNETCWDVVNWWNDSDTSEYTNRWM